MRIPPPALPGAFAFPAGVAAGVTATALLMSSGTPGQPVLSLIVMVAVVDTIAMVSTARATVATGAVCWALHAGFVLGHHGELAFTTRSGTDALVLALCALTALAFSATLRGVRAPLHERSPNPRTPAIPAQRHSSPDAYTHARPVL
ncbi:hypothetical protein [Allokutzneria albata]|uniref:Uncharacterized protein n=1 Tax=Allokutzneria albata TaxID=211114 RepID=A0A1G9SAA7_ALLAB|nr:hypothetical protein [Allokutzneria albata]SDM32418.1 hypothetical protein SAMN04489726_1012 [Allokutzneria albata]